MGAINSFTFFFFSLFYSVSALGVCLCLCCVWFVDAFIFFLPKIWFSVKNKKKIHSLLSALVIIVISILVDHFLFLPKMKFGRILMLLLLGKYHTLEW